MNAKPSIARRPWVALALWVLAVAMVSPAFAAEFRFDTVHSQILVSASHDGYSNPVARLHIASGWLRFDPDHWRDAATDVRIDLTSIDLGDANWNAALRDANYLDTTKHPVAHFVSDHVQQTGDETGILFGTLTLRGVSRPMAINFTFNRLATTIFGMHRVIGFSGTTSLTRTAFGMTANRRSVGTKVTVRLEIEAIQTNAKAGRGQAARQPSS